MVAGCPFLLHKDSAMQFLSKIMNRIDAWLADVMLRRVDYHIVAECMSDDRLKQAIDYGSLAHAAVPYITDVEERLDALAKALAKSDLAYWLDYDSLGSALEGSVDFERVHKELMSHALDGVDEEDVATHAARLIASDVHFQRACAKAIAEKCNYEQLGRALLQCMAESAAESV
jgi:hypothetical protein